MSDSAWADYDRLEALLGTGPGLIDRAADEIERLRGIENFAAEASRHEVEGLRAEIERLRADLKRAIWSDSEECKMLTEKNDELRAVVAAIDEREPGKPTAWRYQREELVEMASRALGEK